MSTIITEIEYTIETRPSDIEIEGNASAIDEETDRATYDWICDQLERGNEWAWCDVIVTAEYRDHKGYASLGCVSTSGEEAFKRSHYEDMQWEAREHLSSTLEDELGKQFSRFLKDPSWTNTIKLNELSTDYRDLMEELKGVQA